jgi:NAD(P)-dependent dehydrogenase (short-subunit alcohol dehydrogenase family)
MKYYLITGASSGIGYATCQTLIKQGHFVFGSVRKESDAARLQQAFGNNFQALIFDVCDEKGVQDAVVAIAKVVGKNGLAGLVNNAGIVVYGPINELELSEFKRQMDVNVYGLLRVTKAFLPLLGAQHPQIFKPGKIVNISSVSGIFTTPFLVPYCVSKKAVEVITDGLRMELLPYGIDVVSILPGPVKTSILKALITRQLWNVLPK